MSDMIDEFDHDTNRDKDGKLEIPLPEELDRSNAINVYLHYLYTGNLPQGLMIAEQTTPDKTDNHNVATVKYFKDGHIPVHLKVLDYYEMARYTLNDNLMMLFVENISIVDLSTDVFIRLIKNGLRYDLAEVFIKWYFLLDFSKWNTIFKVYDPLQKNESFDHQFAKLDDTDNLFNKTSDQFWIQVFRVIEVEKNRELKDKLHSTRYLTLCHLSTQKYGVKRFGSLIDHTLIHTSDIERYISEDYTGLGQFLLMKRTPSVINSSVINRYTIHT